MYDKCSDIKIPLYTWNGNVTVIFDSNVASIEPIPIIKLVAFLIKDYDMEVCKILRSKKPQISG